MKRTSGFTMVEVLTVIAIVAILAAIITPVYAQVKQQSNKANDLSSLNSIRSALQQYREDQGAYPPHLLGYISPYEYSQGVNIVPADRYRGALYPKRIDSIRTLRPILNRFETTTLVPAVWPQADSRPVGSAPVVDTNGDGNLTAADDLANNRQAYFSDLAGGTLNYFLYDPRVVPAYNSSTNTATDTVGRFYAVSGYDVAQVGSAVGNVFEVRYTLFWTGFGVNGGSLQDDPRQLGYSEPPETTVITWNSAFRDADAVGGPRQGSLDQVLFLGGQARNVSSAQVRSQSWRLMPR